MAQQPGSRSTSKAASVPASIPVLGEDHVFAELQTALKALGRTPQELEEVEAAYAYARQKHEGQKRKNGENYIVHPVCVALILTDIPVDHATIIAALLHDVLEDTDTTPEALQKRFGKEVLRIVEGVTKLGKLEFTSKEERQAENFRRMFLAMADDVRIVLLKLADRLHNIRTLCFLPPEKQAKKALETLEIFAPLANRLGMGKIRSELEDTSMQYLYPEAFQTIRNEIAHTQADREQTIGQIVEKLRDQLLTLGIQADISGRVKNYYSIYRKMQSRGKQVDDIFDLSAVRIIVNSEKECYEVLGLIHQAFKPIPGRFKDYIAMPKSNLYQSLHTTVIGPNGKPMEVQIRSWDMHHIAEYGIAAHWKYKEAGSSVTANNIEAQQFSWLKKMLAMKDDADDPREFVDSVKLDLFRDEVFVFTPKGKVVDLPRGSTPVDFAYRIHTEVGNTCAGAMVNGKIVPLDTVLRNGDIVDIITNKKNKPRLDWIKFVETQQAKARIRQWFKRNYRSDHELQGKALLEAELTRAGFDEMVKSGKLMEAAKALNYTNLDDLFLAVGYGEMTVTRVINRLKNPAGGPDLKDAIRVRRLPMHKAPDKPPDKPDEEPPVTPEKLAKPAEKSKSQQIQGLKGMLYHVAKCCTPMLGEPIVGIVTRSRGVMIHRDDCENLHQANPNRRMEVTWDGDPVAMAEYRNRSIRLEISVIDRVGIFKDILTRIADLNTNLTDAKVRQIQADHTAVIEVSIDINSLGQLDQVKQAIERINDVLSVRRA